MPSSMESSVARVFSDAHPQLLLLSLEAGETGSTDADGTHSEMVLLRVRSSPTFFFPQITFLETLPILEKSPERDHGSRAKGREVSGERVAISVLSRRWVLYGFVFPF